MNEKIKILYGCMAGDEASCFVLCSVALPWLNIRLMNFRCGKLYNHEDAKKKRKKERRKSMHDEIWQVTFNGMGGREAGKYTATHSIAALNKARSLTSHHPSCTHIKS